MADPIAAQKRFEAVLTRILDRSRHTQGLFWDISRVRSSSVRSAILQGRIAPIVEGVEFRNATTRAARRLTAAHEGLVRSAMSEALAEVGVTGVDLDRLVTRIAGERARTFLRQVEGATRRNLSRLVRNASRRYRRSRSFDLLRNLVKEIRPHLALTPKLSSRIASRVKALRRTKSLAAEQVDRLARTKARQAGSVRAAAAAEQQLAVAVNTARHEAWGLAIARGKLPRETQKRWVDQGDKRVRLSHQQQTALSWIPFDDLYQIFEVPHPPAEFGCRCYEEIRTRPGTL